MMKPGPDKANPGFFIATMKYIFNPLHGFAIAYFVQVALSCLKIGMPENDWLKIKKGLSLICLNP